MTVCPSTRAIFSSCFLWPPSRSPGPWTGGCRPAWLPSAVGAALGAALVGVILVATPMLGGPDNPLWLARQLALMKLPLVLAAGLAGLWLLDSFGRGQRTLLVGMAGACLGWGLASHLTADVGMSQFMRSANLTRTHTLARLLPNGSALVAYWGRTDAVAPLLLTRDIVVIDPWADNGADAPVLIRALLEKGRRVFLLNEGLTPELSNRIVARLEAIPVTGTEVPLVELRAAQVGLLETSPLRATSR